MAYSLDDLCAYAKSRGVETVVVAGFDGRGRFVFCSTDGHLPDIREILRAAAEYIAPAGLPRDDDPEATHPGG